MIMSTGLIISPNITGDSTENMRLVRHVARIGEIINAYRILIRKPEIKTSGRRGRRLGGEFKLFLK
jgi:hypothetical protein